MNFINYIPCKLASKRIRQKNIKMYGGCRLIDYTLNVASKTGWPTLVSSESAQILDTFKEVQTHLREGALAAPTLSNLEVMQAIFRDPRYDNVACIVLLQPTHPLRRVDDLIMAATLYGKLCPPIPLVSVSSEQFHATLIDRRTSGTHIDGRFYFLPLNYVRNLPRERSVFFGCFAETAFHVDIDTPDDEQTFLEFLSCPEALKADGYSV